MALHHGLLALSYQPLHLLKSVGRPLGLAASDCLRVLLYHDVAPHEEEQFAKQLRWLARSWSFATPRQFAAMISGEEPAKGRHLLLTFDDGFASNRTVADRILNPMGIKALFFVVSQFAALEDRDQARQFIARHIQPGKDPAALPEHLCNMTYGDLEMLLEEGHVIGGHTRTHARLSELSASELEGEVVGAADDLARRLGTPIEHFAYTFGDLASFSPEALSIARRRYRYLYSGLRGNNIEGGSPLAVRREAIGAADSLSLLGAFVEGAADFRYARSREELSRWASR